MTTEWDSPDNLGDCGVWERQDFCVSHHLEAWVVGPLLKFPHCPTTWGQEEKEFGGWPKTKKVGVALKWFIFLRGLQKLEEGARSRVWTRMWAPWQGHGHDQGCWGEQWGPYNLGPDRTWASYWPPLWRDAVDGIMDDSQHPGTRDAPHWRPDLR